MLIGFHSIQPQSDELIATVYNHLFNIPVTGLRFFTVYGPWGRPDMAVYTFTNRIMAGRPVNMFVGGRLLRDFTYVDDIIDGVVAAIKLGANNEVFNLGKGHPEDVTELLDSLEKELRKNAIRQDQQMQPGDVEMTFADIRHSASLLGFTPRVPLREGLRKWVGWYTWYHGKRSDATLSARDEFMRHLEEDAARRDAAGEAP